MSFRFKLGAGGWCMLALLLIAGCSSLPRSVPKQSDGVLADDLDAQSLRRALLHSLAYL